MGKGRAPCCDKNKVKKGPWSPAEDLTLITFIQKHGHENWRALPKQAGLLRCGKSCRLRWINYLRPDVKRGNFTKEEEDTIVRLHQTWGNKWSKIASQLAGRTDNEIKNVWNTHLKKRLTLRNANHDDDEVKDSPTSSSSSCSTILDGKRAMKDEVDNQGNQGSMNKKPRMIIANNVQEFVDITDAKELSSSSSSSILSDISNFGQVDDLRLRHEMEQLLSNSQGPYDVISSSLDEVNQPGIVEFPMESDFEFWDLLDTLSPLEEDILPGIHNLGDAHHGEIEHRNWLRQLESELGLEPINYDNDGKS